MKKPEDEYSIEVQEYLENHQRKLLDGTAGVYSLVLDVAELSNFFVIFTRLAVRAGLVPTA